MVSIPCVSVACFSLQSPFRHDLILLMSGLLNLSRTLCFITMQETEPSEPGSGEVRKPKAAAPSTNKRPKKEAKKKR